MKHFNLLLVAFLALIMPTALTAQDCSTFTPVGTTLASTAVSLDERGNGIDSAWYSFTPGVNGYITITSCDASSNANDTRLFLYDGDCNALNLVATSDNDCGFAALLNDKQVVGGKDYFILWDNKSSVDPLSFNFEISFVDGGSYDNPDNDDICEATILTVNDTLENQSNEHASVQGAAGEFSLGNNAGIQAAWSPDFNVHNTVWYSFVAPASGAASIELDGTAAWDAQLAVFEGTCNFAELTFVAADEAGTNMDPIVNMFCLTPGATYYVLVDGFGTESGDFDISFRSIDLRAPYVILFDADTNLSPAFACPGEEDLELYADLVVAEDSSLIDNPVATGDVDYDNWYQNALTEYVDALEWELATDDGNGAYAYDEDLGAGTYTAWFFDGCRDTVKADFTFVDEVREELSLSIIDVVQPGCVGESGSLGIEVIGGFKFDNATTYQDDSVYVYYKKVSLADGVSELDDATKNLVPGNSTFFSTSLTEGIYRVIVEDGCGNEASADVTIENPTVQTLVAQLDGTVNPYCPESNTGAINLFTSGGQNKAFSFTWTWSDTVSTTEPDTLFDNANVATMAVAFDSEDYTMATQGWYRAVVFDNCNQRDTVFAQIVDPVLDSLEVTAVATNPTTFAAQDGSIAISATGGNSMFNAVWWVDGMYTPEMDDMLNPTGLAQGIYTVYVEDTCATLGDTTITFILTAPVANDEPCNAIVISEDDTLTTYHNQGATVAAGESAALAIPSDVDEGFNGWEETGVQSSVWFSFVAPASGAVELSAERIEMIGNLSFDPQLAVFSATDCNDFATFQYLAANDDKAAGSGDNNSSYLEVYCLTPGNTYYVLVDGFAGIGQEGLFDLDIAEIDVPAIEAVVTKTNVTCSSQGSITISNIVGGVYLTSPVSYMYSINFDGMVENGVVENATRTYNNLAAGTYNVTVADTCGNVYSKDVVIEGYNPGALVIDFEVTAPTCEGGSDAVVEVEYTEGAGGYTTTYKKFGGAVIGSVNGASPAFYNLDAGNYVFTVTDVCGNVKDFEVAVVDPVFDPVVVTFTENDPECPGEANGEIAFEFEGGSGDFNLTVRETGTENPVLVTNLVTDSSHTVTGLAANEYYFVFTDICGTDTVAMDTVQITDPVFAPVEIDVDGVNPSAPGLADGSFSFTIAGGSMPYTVFAYRMDATFSNILETLTITDNSVSGLAAGNYRVAADDNCDNDANNFSATEEFTLIDPPAADDVCDATMLSLGTPVNGNSEGATIETGELGLNIPLDGECDDFDSWCDNGIDGSVWYTAVVPASGALSIEVLSGDFDAQVAVFTADSCSNFDAFTYVGANDDKDVDTDTDSYLEVGCLTPGAVVYILVDEFVIDGDDFVGGDFSIEINAINTTALQVLGNITNPSDEISNDGAINVQLVGGVAPFTYAWEDNGSASTVVTQDRTGLAFGSYKVTVTDACGSEVSKSFTLVQQGVSYDDVCDAVLLAIDGNTREFSNEGATLQAGETEAALNIKTDGDCFSNTDTSWCTGDGLDASIWFKFYAPASGKVNVDLCNGGNNTFDTQLAVFRSNTCTNFAGFSIVGANDDFAGCALGSVLNLTDLEPCGLYYILVDTDDDQRGTVGIKLEDPEAGVNAGDDVNASFCEEDGTVNLLPLIDAAADQTGSFVDVNATGALTGSNLNVALLGEGVYTFEYRVTEECNGVVSASDVAVLTITVDDCVGIVENNGVEFKLFPNPSNGVFAINTANSLEGVNVTVTDFTGKTVVTMADAFNNTNKLDINITGVATGVYAVRLSGSVNGIFKVIVE